MISTRGRYAIRVMMGSRVSLIVGLVAAVIILLIGSIFGSIAAFFGGQGSINVNSWAGDSRHVAFVSYELSHK